MRTTSRHRALRFELLESRLCLSTAAIFDNSALEPLQSLVQSDSSLVQPTAPAPSGLAISSQSQSTVQLLDPMNILGNTGEKPQSKVWSHDGHWWTVIADAQGTALWKLDGDSWTRLFNLSATRFRADVKVVGDLAHVLLEKDSSSRLVTLEYLPATDSYQLWSLHPGLVAVPLVSATETATLDVDSTGRMWIAYDTTTEIRVIHSQAPYSSWSQPITIASGVTTDDISAIIAMPGNKIGVLWSNQNTQRFGFRVHEDGAAPGVWSADEVPASQSALNIGGGMADDHLNIVTASDGTLYAAVKTSYDTASQPSIALLVRRPDGQWDPLYSVDNNGTRGIVELSETQNRLLVFYRDTSGNGPIVYRESALDSILFGSESVLIAGANLNNPSSMKGAFGNEIVVIASGDDVLHGAILQWAAPANQPPQVNAGADVAVLLSEILQLDGTVSDDGLPVPPGGLSTLWEMVSGPAAVSFGDATAVDTTATFTQTGTYVLRLSASDGELTTQDEITVEVNDEAPANQPPQVNAGADVAVLLSEVLQLDGTVSDDDLPVPPGGLSTLWEMVSGPAAVSFGDGTAVDTTATFTQTGTYVLRLSASDGELTTQDEITVEVNDEAPADPVTISFRQELLPTTGYLGMTDAKIRKANPSTNFADEKTILVDGVKPAAGLLRWDISEIPENSQIMQVHLTFTITDASVEQFEFYEVLRNWVESEVTWNQASAGMPWGTPGASGASDRGTTVLGTLSASNGGDVTLTLNAAGIAVVQAWVNETSPNYGFIIQDYSATNSLAFRTSEGASKLVRPILTITYLPTQPAQSSFIALSASARSESPGMIAEFATVVPASPVAKSVASPKTTKAAQPPQVPASQLRLRDRVFQSAARVADIEQPVSSGRVQGDKESMDIALTEVLEWGNWKIFGNEV